MNRHSGDQNEALDVRLHMLDRIRRTRLQVRRQIAERSKVIMNLFRSARIGEMNRPLNASNVPLAVRWPAFLGLLGLLGFFGGLGVWASTAPIAGAAVAPGSLVASGQNKIIQHLEGGIIKSILVKEGDVVTSGQILVRLEDTLARAQLRRLELKQYRLRAMQARLEAEQHLKREITFPEDVTAALNDPEVKVIVEGQESEFKARQDALASEIAVLNQRIAAIGEEISGLTSQHESALSQLSFIERELTGKQALYDKGLTQLPALLALKRAEAKLIGEKGEATAQMGRAKERIAGAKSQIIHLKNKRIEAAAETARNVESELDDVEERVKAASDILARIEIKAPVRGIVIKLAHHTPGGVLSAGQDILELLPVDKELLIEARMLPQDIDSVKVGQMATVMFSALNQRTTPVVDARVEYVSADRLFDDKTRQSYYLARLRFADLEGTGISVADLYPGMQVDTFIRTTERTFVEYLVRPIRDSFQKAFREN